MCVHVGLCSQSLDCDGVVFEATEQNLSVGFLCCFDCQLSFESWGEWGEIAGEIEQEVNLISPQRISKSPQNASQVVSVLIVFSWEVLAHLPEQFLVSGLRVFGIIPPILSGLYVKRGWFNLLNQLSCSVGESGRGVCCSNQE